MMNLIYQRLRNMRIPNYDPRPDLYYLNDRVNKLEETVRLILTALEEINKNNVKSSKKNQERNEKN